MMSSMMLLSSANFQTGTASFRKDGVIGSEDRVSQAHVEVDVGSDVEICCIRLM